jgi:hypothetical protein
MARDYTRYTVKGLGQNLNKRQLVFTIVKDWTSKNNPTLEELQAVFPDGVQGSKGFIVKESEVKDAKRFNMQEPLTIKNGDCIVVSNQWGTKNISSFIDLTKKLGYDVTKETLENDITFTSEQIDKIGKATWFYDIEQVMGEILGIETYEIPSLEIESYLKELAEDKTFGGIETELPYDDVARTANKIYGNLCYLSQYDQEGKGDKTSVAYSILWADLLKILEAKATTANEYWAIGESSLERLTPFEDKDEMEAFVHSAYDKAIDLDDDISILTVMANRLNSEYYTNNELLEKAGERCLSLAETFKDYSSICFNDNEENLFSAEIFNQALDKVIELKEQAVEDELENLLLLLADDEDYHDKIKQIDPNFVPPTY